MFTYTNNIHREHTPKSPEPRHRKLEDYVWDAESVRKLISLWKTDLKAREIAEEFCVTRNAIIGKVSRLYAKYPELRRRT